MFDVCEMLGAGLLDAGQQQKAVAIWGKYRVRLYIEPLVFRRSFIVVLGKKKNHSKRVKGKCRQLALPHCTSNLDGNMWK
jgi:hypothetical protein